MAGFSLSALYFAIGLSLSIFLSSIAIVSIPHEATAQTIQQQQSISSTSNFLLYENPSYGIQIVYPSNWQKIENNSRVIFSSPLESNFDLIPPGNLAIAVNNITSLYVLLDEVVEDYINSLNQSLADFKVIESNAITLKSNTSDAHRVVYTYREGQEKIKTLELFMINDGNAYRITYTAKADKYDNYLSTIQKMIDSFEFIDFIPYQNSINGVKLLYPSNWQNRENGSAVRFFSLYESEINNLQKSLDIMSSPAANIPLTQIVREAITYYNKSLADFKVIESNAITLKSNTSDAHRVVYTYREGQEKIKTLELFMINDGNAYRITYTAKADKYDNYLSTIQKMIDSLEVADFLPVKRVHFREYENPIYRIKILYPFSWQQPTEYIDSIYFEPYSSSSEYVKILSFFSPEKWTLDQIITDRIKTLRQDPTVEIIGSNTNPVSDHNLAYKIIYKNFLYKIIEIYIIRDDKAYTISFFAQESKFDAYLPTVQKMIDSFQIIDSLPYENLDKGIKIQYPSDWEKEENENETRFLSLYSPDTESAGEVDVNVFSLSSLNSNLSALRDESIDAGKNSLIDYRLITSNIDSILAGYPAYNITYEYNDDIWGKIKAFEIGTIIDNTVYFVEYFENQDKYDRHLPTVQKMIDSFQIIDSLPYENLDKGIKIQYPSHWEKYEGIDNNIVQLYLPFESESDTYQENLWVRVVNLPAGNDTLDEYLDYTIKSYNYSKDFKLIESNTNSTIAGRPAYNLTYTEILENGTELNAIEIGTIIGGKVYYINYYAELEKYLGYLSTIQNIMDSFQIIDSLPYENLDKGIKIQYPSHWEKEEDYSQTRFLNFFSPNESNMDIYQETLQLGISNLSSSDMSLVEVLNASIDGKRRSWQDFKLLNSTTNSTLADRPAYNFTFSYNDSTFGLLVATEISTVIDNKLYFIQYFAEPEEYFEYLPTVQNIMDSFQIIDSLPYENLDKGIKIQYPSHWEKEENENEGSIIIMSPLENIEDSARDYVKLFVYPISSMTLDEEISVKAPLQNLSIIKHPATTTLANNHARMLIYNFTDETLGMIKAMKIATQKNDNIYLFTYLAQASKFDAYLPTIQKMIDSFQIIEFLPYEKADFLQYNNTNGIRIKYPSNWEKLEEDNSTVRFSSPYEGDSDSFAENLIITIVQPAETALLDKLIDINITHINNFKNVQKEPETTFRINTTLDNQALARKIVYTYRDEVIGETKAMKVITTINNKTGYLITYTAEADDYDIYLPTIQKMIDSFQIIEFLPYEKADFLQYNNTNGIRIKYPSNWEKLEEDNSTVRFSSPYEGDSDSFAENLVISASPFITTIPNSNMPIDEIINTNLKQTIGTNINYYREIYPHFEINEYNISTVTNRYPAYELVYTYKDEEDKQISTLEVYILINDRLYVIYYYAEPEKYSTHWPLIQKMLDSLQIDSLQLTNDVYREGSLGLSLDSSPADIAVNPNTNKIYVANQGSNTVSVIDGLTNKIIDNVVVGSGSLPAAVAINPNTNKIYVANSGSDTVSVIDGLTNKIVADNIQIGREPGEVSVDADDGLIYLTNAGSNTVSVIKDFEYEVVDNITVGNSPIGVAVNQVTNTLYVANQGSNTVYAIDYFVSQTVGDFEYEVVDNITVGNGPSGIAVNPNTNRIYVANTNSDTVSVIDGLTNKIIDNVVVGSFPYAVAINPNTNRIYVANTNSDTVSVIDGLTNKIIDVTLSYRPWDISLNPLTNTIYVTNDLSNVLYTLNGTTNKPLVRVTFNVNPSDKGSINCNYGNTTSNNEYIYEIDTQLICEAKANSIFPPVMFNSWAGSLAPRQTISTIFDFIYTSWLGGKNYNPKINFTVSQYADLTANFNDLIPEYLTTNIIFPILVGSILPAIGGWLIARRKYRKPS